MIKKLYPKVTSAAMN